MLDSDSTTDNTDNADSADSADRTPAPRAKRAAKKAPGKKARATQAPAKKTAAPAAKAPAAKKAPAASKAPAPTKTPAAKKAAAKKAPPAARIRISVLAKELGRSSKDVLTALVDLGESGRTASSAIDEALAERVRTHVAAPTAVAAPRVAPGVVFVAPGAPEAAPRSRRRKATAPSGPPPAAESQPEAAAADITVAEDVQDGTAEPEDVREAAIEEATGARRRRRRGRRGRGGATKQNQDAADSESETDEAESDEGAADATPEVEADAPDEDDQDSGEGTGTRRRRRRRRSGGGDGVGEDDPPNTVVHVREPAKKSGGGGKGKSGGGGADDDGVRGVKGSTRLEARRQRRRDGRDTSRRRPPILTEAEFLARRESVDRVMAVRQSGERTQIAVLEDDVLVEHYVTRARSMSYVGNVYLGRVQNVLPSMEAAFIDIGKGRNGVLYAGEVNWDAAGLEGKSRAIENALKAGDTVLVQVTKDPFGHKGARLTSQVSLPGRFLVYVPGGGMTGISRRLPDTERHRLKSILKKIVPEEAGVIVRTAAEGASEEDLTRDVDRLKAEWATISKKAEQPKNAPSLVHGEPDLAIRVVRDVFNEDFNKLLVQGEDAWKTIADYVDGVAPDLRERVAKHVGNSDLFHDLRVDEGLAKALDRKVWLPSGGSLVIDRTEAMTVIDVNTGKFVGSGGNLEQTVTRNNLEAAEEIVRQLRLRDVGGIVVIDFIDMVLESNRDLVLRRLTECLGRDRTKHQVAEVTSLGLVQMTRKRVGEGLLEAFSETCEVCHGRGVIVHTEPVEQGGSGGASDDDDKPAKGRRKRGGAKQTDEPTEVEPELSHEQREKALAAMNAIHRAAHAELEAAEATSIADLELDAVETVLAGSAIDAELLDPVIDTVSEPVAEPVAEPITEPVAEPVIDQEPEPAVAAVAVLEHADVEPGAEADAEPAQQAPVKAARPRRRRAASRPAGPPAAD